MTNDPAGIKSRKRRHIDVCLTEDVEHGGLTTGLERYRLPYNALTQTSLGAIDLGAGFLGKRLAAPMLVGAMTGGAELSGTINRNLAAAAQRLGVGMMLGSLTREPLKTCTRPWRPPRARPANCMTKAQRSSATR